MRIFPLLPFRKFLKRYSVAAHQNAVLVGDDGFCLACQASVHFIPVFPIEGQDAAAGNVVAILGIRQLLVFSHIGGISANRQNLEDTGRSLLLPFRFKRHHIAYRLASVARPFHQE